MERITYSNHLPENTHYTACFTFWLLSKELHRLGKGIIRTMGVGRKLVGNKLAPRRIKAGGRKNIRKKPRKKQQQVKTFYHLYTETSYQSTGRKKVNTNIIFKMYVLVAFDYF